MDRTNVFEKLKDCLVTDDSMQDKLVYSDLKSPTVKVDTICICLALVSKKVMHWSKVNVIRAYLNAFLKNDNIIFMIISKQLTKILVNSNLTSSNMLIQTPARYLFKFKSLIWPSAISSPLVSGTSILFEGLWFRSKPLGLMYTQASHQCRGAHHNPVCE